MARKERSGQEWSTGWPVVGAGLIGMTIMALHTGMIGVMMKPLGDVFGWSRSEISAGIMVMTGLQLVTVPAISFWLPALGIKRVALAGVVLYALGMLSFVLCTGSIWTWYLGWVILSLGLAGVGPLSWTTAIARAFTARRGIALAVALSGTGIATFISPALSAVALEQYGWRAPFVALFLLIALVLAPMLLWLMNRSSHFLSYAPIRPAALQSIHPPAVWTQRQLWHIVIAGFLMACCVGMIMTHLQPMMRDAGATVTQAASYFALTGPMLIVGRLLGGQLLDTLPTRLASTAMFAVPIICCLLLLNYDGSAFWGLVICALFGLGYGSENDILSYLCARYFTLRDYPFVYSLVYATFGLGFGVSAWLAGAIFDHFGSYDRILYLLIGGVGIGIALIAALGRPQENLHETAPPTYSTEDAIT